MSRRLPLTMTTSREDGCYGSCCANELTQYIPPRTSCTTFRRAGHRTSEMTLSTLHRGLGGGLPRGGAPMLSTFEAARWVEWWAGEGSEHRGDMDPSRKRSHSVLRRHGPISRRASPP